MAATSPRRSGGMRPRRRTTELEFLEVAGEIVIYDEQTDVIHHLNPTASIIWRSCDGTATVPELAGELARAAGLPRERIARDVAAAVRQLGDAGLMQVPKPRSRTAARSSYGD